MRILIVVILIAVLTIITLTLNRRKQPNKLLKLKSTSNTPPKSYKQPYFGRSFDTCADICKRTSNCHGFVYDNINKKCFLSDSPVERFEVGFEKSVDVCNKPFPIVSPSTYPAFHERRTNAMYVCNGDDRLQPEFYMHNNNHMIRIDEGQNPDYLPQVDEYKVNNFNWPTVIYPIKTKLIEV